MRLPLWLDYNTVTYAKKKKNQNKQTNKKPSPISRANPRDLAGNVEEEEAEEEARLVSSMSSFRTSGFPFREILTHPEHHQKKIAEGWYI